MKLDALASVVDPAPATLGVLERFDARIGELDPLTLDDVADVSVRSRADRKHLVRAEQLDSVLDVLGRDFAVVEVAGKRAIGYHTVYFDTPDLATYDDHRKGRRRRYKIRTRHYGDPSGTMLEVKCKSNRGGTVKFRTPHPGPAPDVLGEAGIAYALDTIRGHYGIEARADLDYSLETRFVRTTLVNLVAGERLTIDRWLHVCDRERTAVFDPGWIIAETKTASRHALARHALRLPGSRPGRMSKYCLGVAELRPEVPSNPWRRVHRKLTPAIA